jgi:hypothetical protein
MAETALKRRARHSNYLQRTGRPLVAVHCSAHVHDTRAPGSQYIVYKTHD